MRFHITYEFVPQERNQAQHRFKETGAPPPEGVTMLGRWHSAAGCKGFMIAESTDAVAISKWTQEWTDLISFEITPVLTDEEVGEVIGQINLCQTETNTLVVQPSGKWVPFNEWENSLTKVHDKRQFNWSLRVGFRENRPESGIITHPLGLGAKGVISYSMDGFVFVHSIARSRKKHSSGDLFGGEISEIKKSVPCQFLTDG